MGWFDEQIKTRKLNDEELFSESLWNLGDAVTQRREIRVDDTKTQNAFNAILSYLHYKQVNLDESIKDFNDQMEYVFRPKGIMYRHVKLTDNWWKSAYGSYLGFYKESGSAVAFIPSIRGGYYFINEDTNKKEYVSKKNCEQFDEEAYVFYKPLPLRKIGPKDLLIYAFESWTLNDMILTLGMMGVTTLVGLLTPKLTKFLMSTVIESKSLSLLVSTLMFMFFVTLSSSLFGLFNSLVSGRVNTKMDDRLTSATMMRILSLPASFFKEYASGDLSNRIGYINSLANTLMSTIFSTSLTSLFSLVYISQIFEYAPSMVVPSVIITIITTVVSLITSMINMKRSEKTMKLGAKQSGMSYATISGIQKIKLSGAEKRVFARWTNLLAQSASITYRPIYTSFVSSAISMLGEVFLYYVAAKNSVGVSNYYAFNSAYAMVSGSFTSLIGMATTFANIRPTLEMARPILEAEPEVSEGREIVKRIGGTIELANVSFRYDTTQPNVLNNLNMKINSGEYVAIVGKTGCGKSTLIRLLLGFEKPQMGSVYYDGKDINNLDLKSLRRNIGTVMQNDKLFAGDVYSNITITAPWLTIDEAFEAADLAGIGDDIRDMPMGMNTLISEGQGGISGGQRQRICIARALAGKPKVLIFDEATSALDNITQKQISDALDNLHCTRIVVAHRLSTIRHCDRIIYLEKGNIKEEGTYDELIKLNGSFAKLVERQRLDTNS